MLPPHVEELKSKLEHQKIEITKLKSDLKSAEDSQEEVVDLISEFVQRTAKHGTGIIQATLKQAKNFLDFIDEKSDGAGDYYLVFFESALKKRTRKSRTIPRKQPTNRRYCEQSQW